MLDLKKPSKAFSGALILGPLISSDFLVTSLFNLLNKIKTLFGVEKEKLFPEYHQNGKKIFFNNKHSEFYKFINSNIWGDFYNFFNARLHNCSLEDPHAARRAFGNITNTSEVLENVGLCFVDCAKNFINCEIHLKIVRNI